MTKKLRAPAGTDEANFGAERFRVDNDGTVNVPDEAVESLTGVGGFTADAEVTPVPDGMVRMQHAHPGASCTIATQSFTADEAGILAVPLAAAADLLAHGFSYVPATETLVKTEG